MPFSLGLLSERSLANQPEEVRQGLQEQATRQFLLNTLMGGGLRAGYAASQAVPEQYQTQVEQRAFDRSLAQARQNATVPVAAYTPGATPVRAQGPVMPGEQPPVMMTQFNPEAFLQQLPTVVAQAGPRARTGNIKEFADLFGKTATQVKDGVLYSPGGTPIGFAPRLDTERGIQVVGGVAQPIPQFREARIFSSVPTVSPNMELGINAQGQAIARPIAGAVQAVGQLEASQTAGRESMIPRQMTTAAGAPYFGFVTPPGVQPTAPAMGQPAGQQPVQPATQGMGGATGPTTAQAAVNAAYEPILKDAYAGFKLASGRSGTLQSLRNALSNQNFDTNAFTPAKTALTSFLNATGVTGNNATQYLTSASAFRQGLNTIAAQSVSELPGAISNFELQFAQSRFGTLTDPKQANLYAIDLMEVADKRKREYYNFVQKNPRADVIDAWQNSPQGQKGIFEDPKLRKYLPTRPVASGPNKGKTAYNLPSGEWVVFD